MEPQDRVRKAKTRQDDEATRANRGQRKGVAVVMRAGDAAGWFPTQRGHYERERVKFVCDGIRRWHEARETTT